MFGHWLHVCLERIGHCPVLDRSVEALVAGHLAKLTKDEKMKQEGRKRYGEALVVLRENVAKGTVCVTGEIIAATKMLMIFE
jgi:hypothetical protein